MSFKTDNGGLAVKANIKISTSVNGSTWNTRLSQISHNQNDIFICTYSLPNSEYLGRIFNKRSTGITILANSKFIDKAKELKNIYPSLKIILAPNTHAKMVLFSPDTVWLSSANFGQSGWFENTVGIKNKDVYDFYKHQIQRFIIENNVENV